MTKEGFKLAYASLILIILIGGIFFVYNPPSLTGFAVDSFEKIQKLKLTSMCSPEPEVYRVWEIWNKNNLDLEFSWQIDGTSQNGSGIAIADNYTYFNTSTIEGNNNVMIFINGSQQDSAKSNGGLCLFEPALCFENWICLDWEECINETQIRICSDNNSCNTTFSLPETSQICETQNQTLNETIINETITVNETIINETFINETLANETIFNETIILNETQQNDTLTNATNETILIESLSTNENTGGGSSGGGGSSWREEAKPIVQKNETENMTTLPESDENNGLLENETNDFSNEVQPERFSLFRTVGNAIKVPFEKGKVFFEKKSIDYRVGYGVIFLFIVLVALITLKKAVQRKNFSKGDV